MTSEHGNFPMYGTKVKQDTVILYPYSKHTALNSSFYIIIYMGIFLFLDDLPSKFPFLSIYICKEIQLLKKLKSTAIPSEHGKIPLFCLLEMCPKLDFI